MTITKVVCDWCGKEANEKSCVYVPSYNSGEQMDDIVCLKCANKMREYFKDEKRTKNIS